MPIVRDNAKPHLWFRGRFVLGARQLEGLAALVAFLASEPARDITGTQIPVDGGMLRMTLL
ncbi:hypothetical protein [Algihabitans albus]|uniref:hypothetical protein n=1 Tax=Algihabitans albus TaxID=2164067 RepID=UPI001ABC503A|nr:hypothetical protein [Algihabitans albus]